MATQIGTEKRTYEDTHPWLKFVLDLKTAHYKSWMNLGAAQSKCEHVANTMLPPEVAQELFVMYLAKGVRATTAIEGNTLTEEQVRVALQFAVRQLNLKQVKHFTAAVMLGHPPSYACFTELEGELPEPVLSEFVRVFDQSLRLQNSEYEDKRETRRLGPPQLTLLPAGTFTRLRQERVAEGAPEAQVKIPLLTSRVDFGAHLMSLAGNATNSG